MLGQNGGIQSEPEALHRVTLAHNSMIEYLASYPPSPARAVPIINRFLSLFQRPLVVVLVDRRDGVCRWFHSFKHVGCLGIKIDGLLASRLLDASSNWCINIHRNAFQLGVLEINLRYRGDASIDTDATLVKTPRAEDLDFLRRLHRSIRSHPPSASLFLRHWMALIDNLEVLGATNAPRLIEHPEPRSHRVNGLQSRVLESISDGVDSFYREIRGGHPGVYEAGTGRDGSHLLWVRHRLATKKSEFRPPTIWFYVQQWNSNGVLSILPVFTKSMALDASAVIKHMWSVSGGKYQDGIRSFLEDVNVAVESLDDISMLAQALVKAHAPSAHIEKPSNSFTYAAFRSGASFFLTSDEGSPPRTFADHATLGPRGIVEEEGLGDVLFCRPVLISEFPMFCAVTKVKDSRREVPEFDDWYYNFLFGTGLFSRRFARQIQFVTREIYLRHAEDELLDTYISCAKQLESGVEISCTSFVRKANSMLLDLSRIIPFGRVSIYIAQENARLAHDEPNFGRFSTDCIFFVFDIPFYFALSRNVFFGAFSANDDNTLMSDVRSAFARFSARAERTTVAPLVRHAWLPDQFGGKCS